MQAKQKSEVTALKAHLALNVRDLELSVTFYERLFQVQPSKRRERYAKFDIENPPVNLTLNEKKDFIVGLCPSNSLSSLRKTGQTKGGAQTNHPLVHGGAKPRREANSDGKAESIKAGFLRQSSSKLASRKMAIDFSSPAEYFVLPSKSSSRIA